MDYANRFEIELRAKLDAQIATLKEDVAVQVDSDDVAAGYARFRRLVGEIAGLRVALDLCDETHAEISKR